MKTAVTLFLLLATPAFSQEQFIRLGIGMGVLPNQMTVLNGWIAEVVGSYSPSLSVWGTKEITCSRDGEDGLKLDHELGSMILGPARVALWGQVRQGQAKWVVLFRLRPVNASHPSAAVAPAMAKVTGRVESSGDLENWAHLLDLPSLAPAETNRFFRVRLTIEP